MKNKHLLETFYLDLEIILCDFDQSLLSMFSTRLAHASLDAEWVGKALSWKLKQNHLIALALFAVWPSQGSEKRKNKPPKSKRMAKLKNEQKLTHKM